MSDRDGGTRKWPELPPPGSEFPRSFCVSTSRVVQTRKMAVSILSDGVDSQQPQIILCHRWEAHWNFWHQYYNIIINFILYLSLLICYQHFFQETFRHDIIQESITAGWNQRKHCWNLATPPQCQIIIIITIIITRWVIINSVGKEKDGVECSGNEKRARRQRDASATAARPAWTSRKKKRQQQDKLESKDQESGRNGKQMLRRIVRQPIKTIGFKETKPKWRQMASHIINSGLNHELPCPAPFYI